VSDVFPAQVYGQMIDDSCEPTLRVATRIHLYNGEQEGLLNDIPSIFFREPMPPRRPPDEREEKRTMKFLELSARDRTPGSPVRSSLGSSGRHAHRGFFFTLVSSLQVYCHER
jgi:hypothetical protein